MYFLYFGWKRFQTVKKSVPFFLRMRCISERAFRRSFLEGRWWKAATQAMMSKDSLLEGILAMSPRRNLARGFAFLAMERRALLLSIPR